MLLQCFLADICLIFYSFVAQHGLATGAYLLFSLHSVMFCIILLYLLYYLYFLLWNSLSTNLDIAAVTLGPVQSVWACFSPVFRCDGQNEIFPGRKQIDGFNSILFSDFFFNVTRNTSFEYLIWLHTVAVTLLLCFVPFSNCNFRLQSTLVAPVSPQPYLPGLSPA